MMKYFYTSDSRFTFCTGLGIVPPMTASRDRLPSAIPSMRAVIAALAMCGSGSHLVAG
jgi:hypothetical protein